MISAERLAHYEYGHELCDADQCNIKSLVAEVERLKGEVDHESRCFAGLARDFDLAKARIARLEEALRELVQGIDWIADKIVSGSAHDGMLRVWVSEGRSNVSRACAALAAEAGKEKV